jgi:16S rRNA processing protein RimM
MNKDDFYYLGRIQKAYGNKGHVIAFLDVDDPSEYADLKMVFIGIDDDRIPFFLQSFKVHVKKQVVLLFEDSNSIEDASIFEGKEMYLPLDQLPKLHGKKFYYHEITGFRVMDALHGNIGTVKSVLDLPVQSLLQIDHGGKEILIPITDEIILKVDRKKKEIKINAPEGLIEIYL